MKLKRRAAKFRQRRLVHRAENDALDLDLPGGGAIQATHQVQQRGFAAPRRSQQNDEFALVQPEVDAAQRRDLDAAQRANRLWKQRLAEYEAPALDEAIDAELADFIARRKAELPDTFG